MPCQWALMAMHLKAELLCSYRVFVGYDPEHRSLILLNALAFPISAFTPLSVAEEKTEIMSTRPSPCVSVCGVPAGVRLGTLSLPRSLCTG